MSPSAICWNPETGHPCSFCYLDLGLFVSLIGSYCSTCGLLLVLDLFSVFKALPWTPVWFLEPSKAGGPDLVFVVSLTESRVVSKPLLGDWPQLLETDSSATH